MQRKHLTDSIIIQDKNSQQIKDRRKIPQPSKGHYGNSVANMMFSAERREAFPQRLETREESAISPLSFSAMRRKRKERMRIGKEEIHLSLFADTIIYKNTPRTSKARTHDQHIESIVLLCNSNE